MGQQEEQTIVSQESTVFQILPELRHKERERETENKERNKEGFTLSMLKG